MTHSDPVEPLPPMSTHEALAIVATARADMPSTVDRAVGVLLGDYGRLVEMEREFAARLVPEVVATYGERATVSILQGIVPRLILNPPTRRGGSPPPTTGGW